MCGIGLGEISLRVTNLLKQAGDQELLRPRSVSSFALSLVLGPLALGCLPFIGEA